MVIIKHGKFWKRFTCPQCGCIFHDSSTLFPDELALIRGIATKVHKEVHCPECYTRCVTDEEDKENE